MLNTKTILILLTVGALIISAAIGARILNGEDNWICADGDWIKHGNPSAPKPEAGCGEGQNTQGLIKNYEGELTEIFNQSVKIKIDSNQEIVAVAGEGVKILDEKDNIIDFFYLRRGFFVKALGLGGQSNILLKEIKITSEPPVIIYSPAKDSEISSPITISGEAKGFWFFEAVFPVKLKSEAGQELAAGQMQAKTDWMTEDYVPFAGEISFSIATATKGFLILEKSNPSDLPENEEDIEIPVFLKAGETMKVKAYFNNNKLDPEISCNKVFFIEREVVKTKAAARAALEELLKGVSEKEKEDGYFTNINSGIAIQGLAIEKGVAKVDFDKKIEEGMGGSCRAEAIRAQIAETLKQFSAVKNVVISVDGRTEDILQP